MAPFCIDASASLSLLPNICAIKVQWEEHSQEGKEMQNYVFDPSLLLTEQFTCTSG